MQQGVSKQKAIKVRTTQPVVEATPACHLWANRNSGTTKDRTERRYSHVLTDCAKPHSAVRKI